MKFSIKDFFSKFQFFSVTFTEEILNGNFIFCAVEVEQVQPVQMNI